jgi:hypothetical protein
MLTQKERTEPSGDRPCRHGMKSSLRCEPPATAPGSPRTIIGKQSQTYRRPRSPTTLKLVYFRNITIPPLRTNRSLALGQPARRRLRRQPRKPNAFSPRSIRCSAPQSLVGNFRYFGPHGAGFGRRSLLAIFQFPFRRGGDWFDSGQSPLNHPSNSSNIQNPV